MLQRCGGRRRRRVGQRETSASWSAFEGTSEGEIWRCVDSNRPFAELGTRRWYAFGASFTKVILKCGLAQAPLPMLERLASAGVGKKSLDKDRFLETVKNPRVRVSVRLGKLAGFMKMPFDIVLEVRSVNEVK